MGLGVNSSDPSLKIDKMWDDQRRLAALRRIMLSAKQDPSFLLALFVPAPATLNRGWRLAGDHPEAGRRAPSQGKGTAYRGLRGQGDCQTSLNFVSSCSFARRLLLLTHICLMYFKSTRTVTYGTEHQRMTALSKLQPLTALRRIRNPDNNAQNSFS